MAMNLVDWFEERNTKSKQWPSLEAMCTSYGIRAQGSEISSLADCPPVVKRIDVYRSLLAEIGEGVERVEGDFDVSYTPLYNLHNAPKIVVGTFNADGTNIKNTDGIPAGAKYGSLNLSDCHYLSELTDMPEEVDYLSLDGCKNLHSLEGIHKKIKKCKNIYFYDGELDSVTSNVLGVLLLGGIEEVIVNGSSTHKVGGILTNAIKEHPGVDQVSMKRRLMYASRRLIEETPGGKELAKL